MQNLEVSGAVRHIYIYGIRRLKVNRLPGLTTLWLNKTECNFNLLNDTSKIYIKLQVPTVIFESNIVLCIVIDNSILYFKLQPIPVAARPKTLVCDRSHAGIVGSNPAGGMGVCREDCVLLGIGLRFGLITHPEESYRVYCV